MKIQLKSVSIGYNQVLVNNINAELASGQIAVLLGKNGSGKSTLLKSLIKFIPIIEGNIYFDEVDINAIPLEFFYQKVSIVLSNRPEMNPIKAKDFILHGSYPYHHNIMQPSAKSTLLFEEIVHALQLEESINKWVSVLSDGNFQKINIARALMQNTPLILLDEALSHLDIHNQFMILEILQDLAKKHQKSIILSTHDWNNSLQIADQLWFIKDQQFIAGYTEDVALEQDLIGYLSHPSYAFDYGLHQFIKKERTHSVKVELKIETGLENKIFWLYKALGKENIEIVPQSDIKIKVLDKGFELNKNSSNENYLQIADLIENIKK